MHYLQHGSRPVCECFAGRLVLGAGDEMLLVFAVSCSVRQSAVAMNINIFFPIYILTLMIAIISNCFCAKGSI